ncbi:ABC transporter permease [Frondihabitans cladoniiphilus]|uniref:ABC transporter permease n=1 Tax=Frondihabitans cladoniiphilus TaxID=715785 RepID=A0ABP8VW46_9MICO
MSETTRLAPPAVEHGPDVFGATADDRFEDALAERQGAPGSRGPVFRFFAFLVRRPFLLGASVWILAVLVAAIAPGIFPTQDPLGGDPIDKLQGPNLGHWFGTDQLGRDLFARVLHGTGLTLGAALLAVGIGLVVGSVLGLLAGFVGSWVDTVVMRIADVLLAIPSLLLSLALITVLGFGTVHVAIAVGLASIATVARIMRSEVVRVRTSVYVEAAQASGNRWWRVLLVHVLPNSAGPVLVLAALEFGTAILAVSSLSFLGYGAQPPTPEWGSLVSTGRDFLRTAWWLTTAPGIVIALTVLSANRVSRALDTEGRRSR